MGLGLTIDWGFTMMSKLVFLEKLCQATEHERSVGGGLASAVAICKNQGIFPKGSLETADNPVVSIVLNLWANSWERTLTFRDLIALERAWGFYNDNQQADDVERLARASIGGPSEGALHP